MPISGNDRTHRRIVAAYSAPPRTREDGSALRQGIDKDRLLLGGLCSLLFGPAPLLRSSNTGPRFRAQYPLLAGPVAERRRCDPGTACALQESTNFLQAANFFVNCSN